MTKLTKFQKQDLRDALSNMNEGDTVTCFPEDNVTVATSREFPDSKMLRVSISFCSDVETKFRKKVGKYHTLNKMGRNEFIQLPVTKEAEDNFITDLVTFVVNEGY